MLFVKLQLIIDKTTITTGRASFLIKKSGDIFGIKWACREDTVYGSDPPSLFQTIPSGKIQLGGEDES